MDAHDGAAIEARGLTVERGRRTVLKGIDLAVPRGQVTGLLGPSGCGKTTLMRAVVGVQAKVSGDLAVLGEPAGSPSLRRRVAYATQAASVYDDLTVRQNLRYFARVLGAPGDEADRVIELVGLQDHAGHRVETLSGGQRNRVSLAAALLGAPELIVLDEPTVGLDPVLRAELWGLFHCLAEGGTSLLVSSHVMDEALRCDRLLLMREGRIIADTTPDELLARTGASDPEAAFLAVIAEREGTGTGARTGSGGTPDGPGARDGVRADGAPARARRDGEPARRGRHAPAVPDPDSAPAPVPSRSARPTSSPVTRSPSGSPRSCRRSSPSASRFSSAGFEVTGPIWQLGLVAVLDALLGTGLGLLASAFARTEFQAVQFMPVLVLPQILLGGLLMPRDQMPGALHAISDWLPLSYAVDAVNAVAAGDEGWDLGKPLVVIAGVTILALGLAALTLRRRTP